MTIRHCVIVPMLAMLLLAGSGQCSRILGLFPLPSRSHMNVHCSLMKDLAGRGHQVTVLGSFPMNPPVPNYTDLVIKNFMSDIATGNMFDFAEQSYFQMVFQIFDMGLKITEIALQQPATQELINSKDQHFDLIFISCFLNEALFGFAHKFNAPVIVTCPFGGLSWMGNMVGNPTPYAYVPEAFTTYTDHMTFTERFINTIEATANDLLHKLYYLPKQDALMRQYFKEYTDMPNIEELYTNVSLLMVNQHLSMSYPRPLVPNMIQVGGLHIKPAATLPKDIKEYLDEAKEGVIYFSMGSMLQSSAFPENIKEAFLGAFAKLKLKVLWKWEKDALPTNLPNVMMRKWLPQNDILAHPNVVLFITHGGLLSSQEAIYHGVPMLGIPVLGDQKLNMAKIERNGCGLRLDLSNVTTESLQWAIAEVVENQRYHNNIKKLSVLFKDNPQSPMETAIFWTEHVLRHKGARHMRSGVLDLYYFQYMLLDVIFVLIAVMYLLYILIKITLVKYLSRKEPSQKVTKSKGKKREKLH